MATKHWTFVTSDGEMGFILNTATSDTDVTKDTASGVGSLARPIPDQITDGHRRLAAGAFAAYCRGAGLGTPTGLKESEERFSPSENTKERWIGGSDGEFRLRVFQTPTEDSEQGGAQQPAARSE